jgi:hypothetical protein
VGERPFHLRALGAIFQPILKEPDRRLALAVAEAFAASAFAGARAGKLKIGF